MTGAFERAGAGARKRCIRPAPRWCGGAAR